jgi:hypothetical protein
MKKALVIAFPLTLAVSSSLIAGDALFGAQNKSAPNPRQADPFSGLFGGRPTSAQPNNQWWLSPPPVSAIPRPAAKCMKVVRGDPNLDPDIRRNPRTVPPGAKVVEPTIKVVVPPPCVP